MASSSSDALEGERLRSAVFPLELSPLEKCFFWEDSDAYPMTPLAELRFASLLNMSAMEQAVQNTLADHPLLSCRVTEQGGSLFWQPPEESPQENRITQVGDGGNLQGFCERIDLRSGPGIRLGCAVDGVGCRLLIQWHHACCDGVGMRGFIVDLLSRYDAEVSQHDPPRRSPRRPDWGLLRGRFDTSEQMPEPANQLTLWQRLKNARYFHFQPPRPLASRVEVEGNPSETTEPAAQLRRGPMVNCELNREDSQAILEACKKRELPVSELATALLFKVCRDWNRGSGDASRRSRLRIMLPYDLRTGRHGRMPAANRMSFAFLGRSHGSCENFDELLKSVRSEMASIKRTRLPLDFLAGLSAISGQGWLMRWVLGAHRNMATAVLTYTGDVSRGLKRGFLEGQRLRFGDVHLEQILAAPPARKNTKIAIGLCLNWGQFCFSALPSVPQFSASDTEQFLAAYRDSWREWLIAE